MNMGEHMPARFHVSGAHFRWIENSLSGLHHLWSVLDRGMIERRREMVEYQTRKKREKNKVKKNRWGKVRSPPPPVVPLFYVIYSSVVFFSLSLSALLLFSCHTPKLVIAGSQRVKRNWHVCRCEPYFG